MKDFTSLFTSEEFKKNIKDVAKSYALPTILTMLGTGAIGASAAARNEILHEAPSKRRKRILRSALFPALTTLGIAGTLGTTNALLDLDTKKIIDDKNVPPSVFDNFLSKVSPTVLDYGAVPTGVGIAASKAGMKLGIPQADNDWGKKAILEFHTDTPNETIGLGKGKKFKWVKKLPKIGFKKGPLATLLYLLGGATAGTIVDKGIEEVFNVENK